MAEGSSGGPLEATRRLALEFVFAGAAFFALGGIAAWVLRLVQTNVPVVGLGPFYALMTAHGLVMFLGFAGMGVMGPSLYALADVMGGRLRAAVFGQASFWLMVAGNVLVLVATVLLGFGASWVFLYPLAFNSAGAWGPIATFVFTLGVTAMGLSIIAFGVVSVATATAQRPTDASRPWLHRLAQSVGLGYLFPSRFGGRDYPIVAVPLAVNGIDMIIATTPLALLLIENLAQVIWPQLHVDPLLAKNVLWFFGHPVVYLLLFPAISICYHIVSNVAKRPLYGGWAVGLAWTIALVANITIWAHHIYIDFPLGSSQAIVDTIAEPLTFSVTLPSLVSIAAIVMTLIAIKRPWSVPVRFVVAAVFSWLVAGLSGLVNADAAMDEVVHNTMWVVGHFHNMALLNIGFVVFAAVYFLVPLMTQRPIASERLAALHLWASILGGYLIVVPWLIEGLLGEPRRLVTSAGTVLILNEITIAGLAIFTLAQIAFAINLFRSLTGPKALAAVHMPA